MSLLTPFSLLAAPWKCFITPDPTTVSSLSKASKPTTRTCFNFERGRGTSGIFPVSAEKRGSEEGVRKTQMVKKHSRVRSSGREHRSSADIQSIWDPAGNENTASSGLPCSLVGEKRQPSSPTYWLSDPGQTPPLGLQKAREESICAIWVVASVSTRPGRAPILSRWCWQHCLTVLEVRTLRVVMMRGEGENNSRESTCLKRWLLWNQKPAEQGDKYSCSFPLQLPNLFQTNASGFRKRLCEPSSWPFFHGGGRGMHLLPWNCNTQNPHFFLCKGKDFSNHPYIWNLAPQIAEIEKPAILT